MSQSPLQETLRPEQRYLDSWQDLATRIRQGNSFSGREPNCLFLNAGGKRFADASSGTGFDLTDDSRGLALADWDHDGDLDVWMSNRTGPRLRFLRNDLEPSARSLSLQLIGDPGQGINRDAIGARVELVTSSGRQIRTVTAGSGFASQSTRWLFFGLGQRTIESIMVRWPNGERQLLNGAEPGGRYVIRYGQPKLLPAVNRSVVPLLPAQVDVPELADAGRVWLKDPIAMPSLEFTNADGAKTSLIEGAHRTENQPLLVNLWALWCQPCLVELKEFAMNQKSLGEALSLLALNVGEPDGASQKLIDTTLVFPFHHGSCDEAFVSAIDKLVSQFVYRHRGVPVPFSFLIGKDHRLYAIYKGPVSSEQLLKDAALTMADAAEQRNASVPLPGIWAGEKFVTNPVAVASVYLEDGRLESARTYLKDKLREEEQGDESEKMRSLRLADLYFHLGRIDDTADQLDDAISNFRAAVKRNPKHFAVTTALASALSKNGEHDEALNLITQAAKALPQNPEVNMRHGEILARAGKPQEAIEVYEAGIVAQPRYPVARQRLVELLVTDPAVVDTGRAAELSKELRRFAPGNAEIIETIALSTGATGDKGLAAEMLRSALSIANRNSDKERSDRIRRKISELIP